ncbi:MAG: hypothetical protein QOI27_406 [Gaiellaceae bacterium]|jgi:hypothetical protein|nr:hypothetical protein [Gaiellaceae bacterium]
MTEPLISLHDAARRLRCSIRHVERLIAVSRLAGARDKLGLERVVESSLVEYENWRAGAIERADAFTR